MASEDYWGESSLTDKDNEASFFDDDNDFETINFVKIEKEKQRKINQPTRTQLIKPTSLKLNLTQKSSVLFPETSRIIKPNDNRPEEIIKCLVLGQNFTLEQFKSKTEKLELLEEAIRWHDGNAILTVVLFLKKTLKESIFWGILTSKEPALNQYLNYLSLHKDQSSLNSSLKKLGRRDDVFINGYRKAIATTNSENKLANLCEFATHHLDDPNLEFYNKQIREQVNLLQRQLSIEKEDSRIEKDGKNLIFITVPRRKIPDMSVMATLYYCCLYHFYLPDNHFASPHFMRKTHDLTEKQFVWTSLRAFSVLKLWKDLDGLFQGKSWLGKTKIYSVIGFEKVALALNKAGAPVEVVTKYVHQIDNLEKKYQLAKKLRLSRVAVDTLVTLRNKSELEIYCRELQGTKEYDYAVEALRASSIKWRN